MTTATADKILLRVTEAADALGVSRAYLYELMQAGTIPVVRLGRSVRIPATALRAWAERQSGPWDGGAAS